jgi:formylglycine-generating enzyme required for sulfatase activity
MYRTEIPQSLYASVMGANPSSLRRESNPVESVTHAEAEAFAQRFGWILGGKARLPTLAEYVAAAGVPGKPPDAAQARTNDNTDGSTVAAAGSAPANAAGFHDLLGNVEEWAMAVPADTRAPVFGGSVATPAGKVWAERSVYKREKSRTLGFRIVIE